MGAKPPLTLAAEWAGRLALGGLFVLAALAKLADPRAFAADIGHYRLLSYPLATAVAVYLPWVELLAGTAVLLRRCERGALLILATLCAVFVTALASAGWRGLDITCGCFGAAHAATWRPALLRSLLLGAVAVVLFRRSRPPPSFGR